MNSARFDSYLLTRARYCGAIYRWPDGDWRIHRPPHNDGAPVSKEVAQLTLAGYLRVVPDRSYPRAVLTNAGHQFLDASGNDDALPLGLHMLPDERLFEQPQTPPDHDRLTLHEDFVVSIGGIALFGALMELSEAYIGTVPASVRPGDHILIEPLGESRVGPVVVAITRVYDDHRGRHACVITCHDSSGLSNAHYYRGDTASLPRVISPVGMSSEHVRPKQFDSPRYVPLSGRLGWSGRQWTIDLTHPAQPSAGNGAVSVIPAAQLASYLSQVCQAPVRVNQQDGRLFLTGLEARHAYHIYWILRQAYQFGQHHEHAHIDWLFDAETARALDRPGPEDVWRERRDGWGRRSRLYG